ncbi:MAG: hypothetical protein QOD39_716 [Mycobacterium sp.]|nr:hypothetical protein [Mycobacterium sp.]
MPKVAIVAGLVVLAVGVATAIALVVRNDAGERTTAAATSTSSSTPSPSSPPVKGQIDSSCRVMTNASTDAITAINLYVDSVNTTGEDARLADEAVGKLDASVRRVELTFGPVLPGPLHDVLKGYNDAAREVSGIITRRGADEEFNAAIERLNSTKQTAVDRCDALS